MLEAMSMIYHKSWDWIMPVVEKIESMGIQFVFTQSKIGFINEGTPVCVIDSPESKKEKTYSAVVEFIIWHNKK